MFNSKWKKNDKDTLKEMATSDRKYKREETLTTRNNSNGTKLWN